MMRSLVPVVVTSFAVSTGFAQSAPSATSSPPKQGVVPQAPPAQAIARPLIEPGPYVIREQPKDWILNTRVRVLSERVDYLTDRELPRVTPITFRNLAMFFPIVLSSASHEMQERRVESKLTIDDRVVVENPRGQTPLVGGPAHSGTRIARIQYAAPDPGQSSRQIKLELTLPVRASRTRFDEPAAMKVPWPSGPFPPEAASTLAPQMFVDMDPRGPYDLTSVQAMIKQWLDDERIADPKAVPPARLAKILAGKMVERFQPSGKGQSRARTGEFEGLEFTSPDQIVRTGRGHDHELAAMLALVYRSVGLPARVVIGYEGEEDGGKNKGVSSGSKRKDLRFWVEFVLFDEAANSVNWVPVDLARLRRASSRPPAIDRPWKYFGTHDELNNIIPFAFTFHPPVQTARAYGNVGFWAWIIDPGTPDSAYQMLSFSSSRASVSGKDIKEQQRD